MSHSGWITSWWRHDPLAPLVQNEVPPLFLGQLHDPTIAAIWTGRLIELQHGLVAHHSVAHDAGVHCQ